MSTTVGNVPLITLNDGNRIPQLGLGVFQIPPEETAAAVRSALEIGYRHIDTAQMYGNEQGVGRGLRESGVDRASVYITSKLTNGFHRPDDARRAFDETLAELRAAFDAETVSFDWKAGDVLLLDNMLAAHGREPFVGPRVVQAVMADPYRSVCSAADVAVSQV